MNNGRDMVIVWLLKVCHGNAEFVLLVERQQLINNIEDDKGLLLSTILFQLCATRANSYKGKQLLGPTVWRHPWVSSVPTYVVDEQWQEYGDYQTV